MTLKEIAQRAGVSISTVSRILNSPDNSFGSEAVRTRVWSIVQETGYTPNTAARALKLGQEKPGRQSAAKNLACFLPQTRRPDENPFFAQISRSVEQQALQMGYSVPYTFTFFDPGKKALVDRLITSDILGIVVLGRFKNINPADFLKKHYRYAVYSGLGEIAAPWDQVICSGYDAACTAMHHLLETNHRRIAFIGETRNESRYRAYVDVLKNNAIEFDPRLVGSCELNGIEGYEAAGRMMEQAAERPTAVFCANDITALAAAKRFRDLHLAIPRDISIISVDDIPMAEFVTPALTTVHMPKNEMGQLSVRLLVDRIEGGHKLPLKVIVPHRLIVRESTRKL